MSRRTRRLGLLAILSTLIGGCGGSTSSSTPPATTRTSDPNTTEPAPTKAAFIAHADAICTIAKTRLKAQESLIGARLAAAQANDTKTSRQALADAVTQDVAIAGPWLSKLRALEPPMRDRAVVAKYLSAVARQMTLFQRFVAALENDDAYTLQTVSEQIKQGKASATGLAQGYGFKVCGSDS
jgi:hypothetical protein